MAEVKKTSKRIVKREDSIVVTLPPVKAPHWVQGFVNFMREQGVVGVAVGLILGIASKSVVDSIVVNLLNPIIGLLLGGGSLAAKAVCLNNECSSRLGYGKVLSDILSFVLIAAVVYFVVVGLKLDKLDKKKETITKK